MTKSATTLAVEKTKDRTAEPRRRATRPARKTKKQNLIRLLSTKSGADIAMLGLRLGWKPHTTRAAITGLRKAGYEIETDRACGGRPARYRIVSNPSAAS